jgi:hypothetical protein
LAIENIEKELNQIYQELDSKWLVLPNFQRQFVWSKEKQKKLLASVLVGLPTGSLLVLQGENGDFSKRELCFPKELDSSISPCEYLLDGQQRLTTLRSIFYDFFLDDNNWSSIWEGLYVSLRNRWFIKVKPDNNEPDFFGWKNLKFEGIKNKTDTDIEDFIIYKPVYKTKIQEPYHPAYKALDPDGVEAEDQAEYYNLISEKFSEEGIVPLWWIGMDNNNLPHGVKKIHRNVLERIAEKKTKHLQDSIFSKRNTEELLHELFKEDGLNKKLIKKEIEKNTNHTDGSVFNNAFSQQWANLRARWVEDISKDLENCITRKMSVIKLTRDETHRAVAIFEALNRGGEPLSTYDLIVAKSARDRHISNLSTQIIQSLSQEIEIPPSISDNMIKWLPSSMHVMNDNEPSKHFKDWFVTTLSLLVHSPPAEKNTCKIDLIKKAKILALTKSDVNSHSSKTIIAISRALSFLQFRCGVYSSSDINYRLMILVLSYHLSQDDIWNSKEKIDKLEYWYWIACFSGFYSKRQNEQCIEDINSLTSFLNNEKNPFIKKQNDRLFNVQDYLTKEILLRSNDVEPEIKPVKNSILQFILSRKPFDFDFSEKVDEKQKLTAWEVANGKVVLEIHHIIPLKSATKIGQSTSELRKEKSHILNSSLNLILIGKEANRTIRDYSPTEYLDLISNMSNATAYIPDQHLIKKCSELGEYEKILEARFELLKSAVNNHLTSLLG